MKLPHHRRQIALAATLAALVGCDNSQAKKSDKRPTVIQSAEIPAKPNAAPAAENQPPKGPAPAAGDQQQPQNTKPSKPKRQTDPYENEDPQNVFVIAGKAPVAEIGTERDAAEINGFVVGAILPGNDSTSFEVGDVAGGTSASGSARAFAKNAEFHLPSGFTEVASYGYSEQGLPLRIRDEKTGALMALVPAGVGHVGSDDGPSETRPAFTPFLETFYMDVTEVTLGQYQKFRDDVKQKKNTKVQPPLNDGKNPNLPALGLPWGIAVGFAHWADKELPTEAEWEHAARGPDGWRTPWGNGKAVWPRARTPQTIAPVAAFPTDQSLFGIYDLAGNAREWCNDYYSDAAHQEASAAKSKTLRNWTGPKKGSVPNHRVVKGNGPDWSAWQREGRLATDRHADVGFRCVLRVKVPSAEGKGSYTPRGSE